MADNTNDTAARQAAFDAGIAAWQEADTAPRGTAEAYAASRRAAAPTPTPIAAPAPVAIDPAAARQAGIDNAIRVLQDNGADMGNPVRQGHAGIMYNSADDTFTQTRAAPSGTDSQPLFDDPSRDLQAERDAIVANHTALVDKLDAGRFDPVTGKKLFDVIGDARALLERQVEQSRISGAFNIERLNALAAQRASQITQSVGPAIQMADGSHKSLEEAAARMAYIDSAPPGQRQQFAADYDRQMQAERTKAITGAIASARLAGRR